MTFAPDYTDNNRSPAKDTTSRVFTFTPTIGQLLVIKYAMDSGGSAPGGPSDTQSLTWTLQTSYNVNSSEGSAYLWTSSPVTSASSITITVVGPSAGNDRWSQAVLEAWPAGSTVGAVGTPVYSASGAPSLTLTTTGTGSAVTCTNVDIANKNNTTRTYRGTSPVEDGVILYTSTPGPWYTAAEHWYSQTATAGSQTVGMTAPTAQQYSLIAIEIVPAVVVVASATPAPFNFTRPAVQRASTW